MGARFLAEGEAIDEDVIARMLVSCAEECARIVLEGESTPAAELTVAARALLDGVEWLESASLRSGLRSRITPSCEPGHFATGM